MGWVWWGGRVLYDIVCILVGKYMEGGVDPNQLRVFAKQLMLLVAELQSINDDTLHLGILSWFFNRIFRK
jgi:hypothetical protein